MAKTAKQPMRVPTDIAEVAAQVAIDEDRSQTEQVTYWLRIGMQVERAASADSRRALAVASGHAQFAELTAPERATAHATIDARIAARAASISFGEHARTAGQTTVSLDDEGALIEIAPDGTRRHL